MSESGPELEGVTHEDIIAAVAILREDKVIKTGRESQAAIKALEAKYLEDRAKDEERWTKLEESRKGPVTPETDPEPVPEGIPPAPPPVPVGVPVEGGGKVKEKKRRGVWFPKDEDEGEASV